MKAIILVGGLGTRLRSVVPDVPKPMAPIQEKPFLAYLMNYLKTHGVTSVTLAVHHLREKIESYFQSHYAGIDIDYAVEDEPLGTGGAILYALSKQKSKNPIFVINGDTFVKLDYRAMYQRHIETQSQLSIAVRPVEDCSRYGKVIIENEKLVAFKEKGEAGAGLINAGVYLINPELFAHQDLPKKFSFENDFLFPKISALKPQGFVTKEYFIDIGIPEDYARASVELPQLVRLPKISVIMPVLNREDTIEKAIRSVIDQQYENLEFIILDGGSKDKTVEIIKKYAKHLTYWHSQYDGSPSVAANLGVTMATGEVVVLFMADDWYENGTLHKVGEAILANPDADIFTCGGKILSYDKNTAQYKTIMQYADADTLRLSFYNICFAVSVICCRFIKKSLYDRIGLYLLQDATGKHMFSNDKEFLLRALLAGAKDIYINYSGHNYLAHKESSTFGNNHKNILKMCNEHLDIAEMYLAKPNISFKQRLFLMYWYMDQSTRICIFKLLDGDFRSALSTIILGLKKYHVLWPIVSSYTTVQIIFKRSLRLARKLFA